MVKKRLENGNACEKCVQAEELLKARGLWERIHEVLWAVEGEPNSPGMVLAEKNGVLTAPFFVVRDELGTERIYRSVLKFIRECLTAAVEPASVKAGSVASVPEPLSVDELAQIERELEDSSPQQVMDWALQRLGANGAIAFSGAEDVVLIDMAKQSGRPFSVFCLDTGRLHPETYEFIDRVRSHYGTPIELVSPDPVPLQALVKAKGLFSFYEDGHEECCSIRKVEPLRRALGQFHGWITGQRRDQSPTRRDVPRVQWDTNQGEKEGSLLKVNPLVHWSLSDVWAYIREYGVPYNPLHDRGFVSIGCAPCTRAARPGEHERAGRWWWEDATRRECGLHLGRHGH